MLATGASTLNCSRVSSHAPNPICCFPGRSAHAPTGPFPPAMLVAGHQSCQLVSIVQSPLAARLRQEEARSMKVERPLEDVVFW